MITRLDKGEDVVILNKADYYNKPFISFLKSILWLNDEWSTIQVSAESISLVCRPYAGICFVNENTNLLIKRNNSIAIMLSWAHTRNLTETLPTPFPICTLIKDHFAYVKLLRLSPSSSSSTASLTAVLSSSLLLISWLVSSLLFMIIALKYWICCRYVLFYFS